VHVYQDRVGEDGFVKMVDYPGVIRCVSGCKEIHMTKSGQFVEVRKVGRHFYGYYYV
jgi:hypothetical protein